MTAVPCRMALPHRVGALLCAVIVMFVSVLFSAAPASAHDTLEASSPKDGATVASVPTAITLTFDNTPAAIGSQIQVQDTSGTDWATGPVEVVDRVATQALRPGAPAGQFTVHWRMVSADSHPIEGTFRFVATGGAAPGSDAVAGTPGALQTPNAAPAGNSGGVPWVGGGIAVVLVVVVVGLVILVRRRLGARED